MKVAKTWEELVDLYAGRGEVRQVETGFELIDNETGIIFDLPEEYRVFVDGKMIDPVQLLTLPRYVWGALLEGGMEPLAVECLCGKVTLTGEDGNTVKFHLADLEADIAQNDVVLVKVHWDMTQGIVDYGWDDWMHQHYGCGVIWSCCKTDDYHSKGDWYWLLQAEPGDMAAFELYVVLMHYVRTLSGVYNLADEVAEDFERNKADFREQMMECLNGLPGRKHWITGVKAEDLWPQYDANLELWEKDENDWQIVELGDSFEIRSRGGSPGEITVRRARFDGVGLWKCSTLVDTARN